MPAHPRLAVLTFLSVSALLTGPLSAEPVGTKDLTIDQRTVADLVVPEADLKVTAWVDRQDDAYRVGEALELFVKTNRDAYVTVIDVGTSGHVHILFPNKHTPDNRILAHQVLQIPGPDAPYRIRVNGPSGHELIKVIATTRPGPIIPADQLSELGPFQSYRGTAESLTKDLVIELKRKNLDVPNGAAATVNKVVRIQAEQGAISPDDKMGDGASYSATAEELFRLGEASFYGDDAEPNHREALRLFAAAAEAGHVGAMYLLARIHEKGLVGNADLALALKWYRKAAELGNTNAMVRLAILSAASSAPDQDFAQSVRWLKKAADQGDGIALLNLGKMHDEGVGVEREPHEAARYLLTALRAGAWTVVDQAAKLSGDTRKELQLQLKRLGHYNGPLDGQIGPETRAAMVDFARTG